MSETEKSFTVTDRRHFTPEGRPREEAAKEAPSSASEAAPAAASEGVPEAVPEAAPPPDRKRPAKAPPAQLSALLLSLAAQASMLLSGEGLPEGMSPVDAVEAAGSVISVLEMLKDKTEGRRTKDEDSLVEDLLYQLRMAWVEKSRAVGE